ncbi:hypothetical protein PR048_007758 [Dryococelus australis]|uniref:Uncharacterized protein n=1 Tax=Dryococelus australis TaxID=614101 RepID=A0ABQ9HV57_9NEOP|nr:hypothetical protein PR048_007758 [Dryococelus australis]
MPLVGGFSRGSPVSPAPLFWRYSILTLITLIGSQDLDEKGVVEKEGVDIRSDHVHSALCLCGRHVYWTNLILPPRGATQCRVVSEPRGCRMEPYLRDTSGLPLSGALVAAFVRRARQVSGLREPETRARNALPLPCGRTSLINFTINCYVSSTIANFDDLKMRITDAIQTVTPDILTRVWNEFEYRRDAVRAAPLHTVRCPTQAAILKYRHLGLNPGTLRLVLVPQRQRHLGLGGHFSGFMSVAMVMLLASHKSEPGSIPDRVTPGLSHVGIVPDDAIGRRVFSGISRFSRPCIPALLHYHLISASSALKTLLL